MTENGSHGARRCLFGREDPDTLSRDLAEQVRQEERSSAEDFERRWNFRIESETPLEGRYQWERIGNAPSTTSGSRGLSSLPSSPVPDQTVSIVVKAPDESSDNEKSSAEEKVTSESSLSSISSKSAVSEASCSSSSEEKDVNQNLVREPVKRKAPVLPIEDTKEAKRAKPP